MTDESLDTGDPVTDVLLFAAVTAVVMGATVFSFELSEETRRRESDREGPGR